MYVQSSLYAVRQWEKINSSFHKKKKKIRFEFSLFNYSAVKPNLREVCWSLHHSAGSGIRSETLAPPRFQVLKKVFVIMFNVGGVNVLWKVKD